MNQVEKRILREEAETQLFSSFIYGMRGNGRKGLRYRNPASVEDALNIATVVHNATELE
jgi:hypothetical protein